MFIAVIQENFDVTEDEKRMHQVKAFLQNKSYKAPSQGCVLLSVYSQIKLIDLQIGPFIIIPAKQDAD